MIWYATFIGSLLLCSITERAALGQALTSRRLTTGTNTFTITSAQNYDYLQIAVSDSGEHAVAGTLYNLFYSTNYGGGWIQSTVESSCSVTTCYNEWVGVVMSGDGQKAVAIAPYSSMSDYYHVTLALSQNYGQTFTPSAALNHTIVWCSIAASSELQYIYAGSKGGGIWYSSNYGVNFTRSNAPTSGNDWYQIATSASGNITAAVTNENTIYVSTNSGVHWKQVYTSTTDGFLDIVVSRNTGQYMYAAYTTDSETGSVLKSSNHGESWTSLTTLPHESNWNEIVCDSTGSIVTVYGSTLFTSPYTYFENEIYQSYNAGGAWSQITTSYAVQTMTANQNSSLILMAIYSGTTYSIIKDNVTFTLSPSVAPTLMPTVQPSNTRYPTLIPTVDPTRGSHSDTTSNPSVNPTIKPTIVPSAVAPVALSTSAPYSVQSFYPSAVLAAPSQTPVTVTSLHPVAAPSAPTPPPTTVNIQLTAVQIIDGISYSQYLSDESNDNAALLQSVIDCLVTYGVTTQDFTYFVVTDVTTTSTSALRSRVAISSSSTASVQLTYTISGDFPGYTYSEMSTTLVTDVQYGVYTAYMQQNAVTFQATGLQNATSNQVTTVNDFASGSDDNSSNSNGGSGSNSSSNSGAIAGAVIGAVAFVALVVAGWWYWRTYHHSASTAAPVSGQTKAAVELQPTTTSAAPAAAAAAPSPAVVNPMADQYESFPRRGNRAE